MTRQELPLRIAGPLLRPVLGEVSYGNVALSRGVGNHVDLRGLPGGAEGIQTAIPLMPHIYNLIHPQPT